MDGFQAAILQQMTYYVMVMVIGILIIATLQRGFFMPFLRVKSSFGKFLLLKIKDVDKDRYKVGEIVDGVLTYKTEGGKERIPISDSSVIYRSLGISWIDFNAVTKEFNKPDFTKISSYDPDKIDSLIERAIYRPAAVDNAIKLIMILVIVAIIVSGISAFFGWQLNNNVMALKEQVSTMIQGSVVAG
jgi:hypothetical protein